MRRHAWSLLVLALACAAVLPAWRSPALAQAWLALMSLCG